MEMTVPDLRDDLVVLRPATLDDVDAITAACQDPEIPRFTRVPSPYGREQGLEYVEGVRVGWLDGTHASLSIRDASDDALIGSVSVMGLDRTPGTGEIGYWVAKEARGRGVATRAVRLVSRWAVADLGLLRLELMTDVDNVASQAVAERAGFTREGVLRSYETHGCGRIDVVMFSLVPSDVA
jgi:RimJ/RimL family protein N-acetyltransferase